jgi:YidC/Oxa1 family membrane protein insertase
VGSAVAVEPPEPTKPPVEVARPPAQDQIFEFGDFRAVTTSYGGVLKSWTLLDPKYQRDHAKGEMVPLNSSGALHVNFANSPDCTFKSTEVIPADAVWTPRLLSPTQIEYVYDTDAIRVVKTFTFYPDNHLVSLKVDVSSKIAAQQTLGITLYGYQDPRWSTSHARGHTEWKASCLRGDVHTYSARRLAEKPQGQNGARWAGFTNGYVVGGTLTAAQAGQFLVAVAPRPVEGGELVACNAYPVTGTPGLMQVDLLFQATTAFKPGDPPVSREVVAYLGPTFYDWLEQADGVVGFSTGFQEVPDFGWFGFIGRPLLWLLHKFYALVGNWGIAIIMLTLLVKLATLYWTTKSIRSMKAMAALAPKMKELQAKYGNDRAKMQQETMAMYKQYGVNPLAGCLPILLQMPIWIALYRMLSAAGELYLETLIPGWIDDLTATDPYYILPIVLIVVMFAQARLQPQTTTGFQQKMLMYGIPLVFGIASFFFPAGLSLYIVTNTILSALHSIYMNKFDKKGPAMAAAIAARGAAAAAKDAKPDAKSEGKAKKNAVIEVEDRSSKPKPSSDDDEADGDDDAADEDEEAESSAAPATTTPTAAQRPRRTSRSRRKRRGKN